MIELRDVAVRYGVAPVVQGVSFAVARGAFVGLLVEQLEAAGADFVLPALESPLPGIDSTSVFID